VFGVRTGYDHANSPDESVVFHDDDGESLVAAYLPWDEASSATTA
jgi:hypothetical protein